MVKHIIYILALIFMLWNCHNKSNGKPDSKNLDTLAQSTNTGTENKAVLEKKQSTADSGEAHKDSLIFLADSLFSGLESELIEISKSVYDRYKKSYKPSCAVVSNGFIEGKGLVLDHQCDEICESFLMDEKDSIKLILPCSYDAGIIGIGISPSCNQFIVYSSYDGPDFGEYYNYRAEVIGFTLSQGRGLKTIKPSFTLNATDWSLEQAIWVSDSEIALKTYEEDRNISNQDNLKYRYYKINVTK